MTSAFSRKFIAFFYVYVQEMLAYRAGSIIWILADVQMAMIMPAVWLSAYGSNGTIFGMEPNVMVTYYLVTLVLSQFIVCHLLWDIAWDIREGAVTMQLLRPYSIFWMNGARNLAWRIMKVVLFAPFLLVFLAVYGSHLGGVTLHLGWPFLVAVVLAHILSFLIANTVAQITYWTTEFQSVFSLYYIPENVLSGRLVPLDSLPGWIKTAGNFLPFRYTVSFPANIAIGRFAQADFWPSIAMQVGWILVFALAGRKLFCMGTRQYTGFGN